MSDSGPVAPEYKGAQFNCPFCGVYSMQFWYDLIYIGYQDKREKTPGSMCKCLRCSKKSFWWDGNSVVPVSSSAPLPHDDMPSSALKIFNEARDVFDRSPRSAAALLRVAIQVICNELGQKGKPLNDAIGMLVADGLPKRVQKALDTVRVVGNHAVHPGQIDFKDDSNVALALFSLTNYVVERMITEPAKIDELFESLPENAKKAIGNRDKPKMITHQGAKSNEESAALTTAAKK